jgi:hypothetical protein
MQTINFQESLLQRVSKLPVAETVIFEMSCLGENKRDLLLVSPVHLMR